MAYAKAEGDDKTLQEELLALQQAAAQEDRAQHECMAAIERAQVAVSALQGELLEADEDDREAPDSEMEALRKELAACEDEAARAEEEARAREEEAAEQDEALERTRAAAAALQAKLDACLPADASEDEVGEGEVVADLAMDHADEALDYRIKHGSLAVGAGWAEARDRRIDDIGVSSPCRLVVDAESLHDPGSEVLDHDVAARHQIEHDGQTVVGARVHGKAAFASIAVRVEPTDVLDSVHPGQFTSDRLDLDDVGPLLSQDLRRQWAGDDLAEVEHRDSFEWSPHAPHAT